MEKTQKLEHELSKLKKPFRTQLTPLKREQSILIKKLKAKKNNRKKYKNLVKSHSIKIKNIENALETIDEKYFSKEERSIRETRAFFENTLCLQDHTITEELFFINVFRYSYFGYLVGEYCLLEKKETYPTKYFEKSCYVNYQDFKSILKALFKVENINSCQILVTGRPSEGAVAHIVLLTYNNKDKEWSLFDINQLECPFKDPLQIMYSLYPAYNRDNLSNIIFRILEPKNFDSTNLGKWGQENFSSLEKDYPGLFEDSTLGSEDKEWFLHQHLLPKLKNFDDFINFLKSRPLKYRIKYLLDNPDFFKILITKMIMTKDLTNLISLLENKNYTDILNFLDDLSYKPLTRIINDKKSLLFFLECWSFETLYCTLMDIDFIKKIQPDYLCFIELIRQSKITPELQEFFDNLENIDTHYLENVFDTKAKIKAIRADLPRDKADFLIQQIGRGHALKMILRDEQYRTNAFFDVKDDAPIVKGYSYATGQLLKSIFQQTPTVTTQPDDEKKVLKNRVIHAKDKR